MSKAQKIKRNRVSIQNARRFHFQKSVKLGRCIAELERIYGIKQGGDRKSDETKFQLKTQDDLASELEINTLVADPPMVELTSRSQIW